MGGISGGKKKDGEKERWQIEGRQKGKQQRKKKKANKKADRKKEKQGERRLEDRKNGGNKERNFKKKRTERKMVK